MTSSGSRLLSGTELAVSRLCLGTMTFGKQVDEEQAASMLDLCLERGINFLDTANVYNGGSSEAILGRLLRVRRDRLVLASKVGIRVGDQPHEIGLSPEAIRHQCEQSLRRLDTDRLDLYYLHQPDPATPLEKTLEAVDSLVRQGKVRCLGASNYASWQVCRMLWLAERNGYLPVAVTQPMYNLLARGIEAEFLPMSGEFGLSTVVYNPLAGGLLTGKHQLGAAPAAGSRFDGNPVYQDRYWQPANFEAVSQLSAAAAQAGRSLLSLALNWLLHHTPVDCVILGASTLEQLQANLDAVEEGPCDPELLAACQEAWQTVRGISPQYNR